LKISQSPSSWYWQPNGDITPTHRIWMASDWMLLEDAKYV